MILKEDYNGYFNDYIKIKKITKFGLIVVQININFRF